ncbi:hypothetical protein DIRU0_E07668 [Diutina rugosa]
MIVSALIYSLPDTTNTVCRKAFSVSSTQFRQIFNSRTQFGVRSRPLPRCVSCWPPVYHLRSQNYWFKGHKKWVKKQLYVYVERSKGFHHCCLIWI